MPLLDDDWSEPAPLAGFRLREFQAAWRTNVWALRAQGLSRVVIDGAGGTGKTSVFAAMALLEWNERGATGRTGRTLVIENRDGLVHQTAQRIRDETGLVVEVEMGDERAGPWCAVVVASVQTLSRLNRLTGFSDSHFSLVVSDEAHLSMSKTWIRVMNYFHYGAESLVDSWNPAADGAYTPKAFVVGTTATPEPKMGAFYQQFVEPRYSYLQAVDDGWLVPPIAESIPVKVDLRKFRMGRTPNGSDFRDSDLTAAMIPIIEELAEQLVARAADRKTIAFVPSVECARLFSEAVARRGLQTWYVSGQCLDRDSKTDAFAQAGMGSVLVNCALYVYGKDFPDVNCVAQFRATVSRSWFAQGIFRGTRVLPGLVNDDMTADERRAAIAASAKPNLLVLDPLFVTDRLDLCDYRDLLTDKPEVKSRIEIGGDAVEAAKKAERDFIASLAKEAKKHANKVARAINPLAFGMAITNGALANYQPQAAWEVKPVNSGQAEFLEKMGFNPAESPNQGYADKLIGLLTDRERLGLATPKQIEQLRKLTKKDEMGRIIPMFSEDALALMKKGQAGAILGRCAPWARKTPVQRPGDAMKMVEFERAGGTIR